MNFHLVAVPALNVNGTVNILQLKRAAGLQRNRLVEVFADGIPGSGPQRGRKQKGKTKNCRPEAVT